MYSPTANEASEIFPQLAALSEGAQRRSPRRTARLSLMTTIFISALLPEELSFHIGSARLTVARAVLILSAPYILMLFVRRVSSARYSLAPSDFFIPLACVWMIVADTVDQGIGHALGSTAILAIEFGMTYIAARTLCESEKDVGFAIGVICLATSAVALISILDPIFGYYAAHDWMRSITGYVRAAQTDFRNGLLRASGTLEHPILLGTMCTMSLLMSGALDGLARWITRICCVIGLVLSWSSGPLGGLLIGICCLIYDRVLRRVQGRWILLLVPTILVFAAVFIATNNPLGYFLSTFTFDPGSAYYRILIWHYAGINIGHSPLFGIGLDAPWYREDWMPSSVDSFWLLLTMSFGFPCSLLVAAGWLSPVFSIGTKLDRSSRTYHLVALLNVAILVQAYVAFTVNYWGGTWMLISSLVGLRVALLARSSKKSHDVPGLVVAKADDGLRSQPLMFRSRTALNVIEG